MIIISAEILGPYKSYVGINWFEQDDHPFGERGFPATQGVHKADPLLTSGLLGDLLAACRWATFLVVRGVRRSFGICAPSSSAPWGLVPIGSVEGNQGRLLCQPALSGGYSVRYR